MNRCPYAQENKSQDKATREHSDQVLTPLTQGGLKHTGYRRPEVEYGEAIVGKGETKQEEKRLTERGKAKKKKKKEKGSKEGKK